MATVTVAREASHAPLPSGTRKRRELPWLAWLASAAASLVAGLAFGLVGLLAMTPRLRRRRRRRAEACLECRRGQRRWMAASLAVAWLTLVGGGLRLAHVEPAVPRCPVSSISSGTSLRDVHPHWESGVSTSLHNVLTAPASGLAVAYARWQGQTLCDLRRPSITLAFVPRAHSTSGSTIGDVFVTPQRPNLDDAQTERLARHEARHSNQWAIATALGGVMLLPVAYLVDESMYPSELNHFEQAAGLAEGGYPPAPVPRPGPRPWALVTWSVVGALLLRTRLRLLFRTVAGRPRSPAPQRCARHTPGW
jgi:hypothetical protein